MIQGSINQLLTLAAAGARFAPGYEQKQELAQVNKQLKGYKEQATTLDKNAAAIENTSTELLEAQNELATDITKASKRRFELQPTQKNFESYTQNIAAKEEFIKPSRKVLAKRKAEEELLAEQERVLNSRHYRQYIGGNN